MFMHRGSILPHPSPRGKGAWWVGLEKLQESLGKGDSAGQAVGWPQTPTPVLLGQEQGLCGKQLGWAEQSSPPRGQPWETGDRTQQTQRKDTPGRGDGLHRGKPASGWVSRGDPLGATSSRQEVQQGMREPLRALREKGAGPGPMAPTARPVCARPCQAIALPNPNNPKPSQWWRSI